MSILLNSREKNRLRIVAVADRLRTRFRDLSGMMENIDLIDDAEDFAPIVAAVGDLGRLGVIFDPDFLAAIKLMRPTPNVNDDESEDAAPLQPRRTAATLSGR